MKFKKLKIWIGDNPSLNEALQKKAGSLGWVWPSGQSARNVEAYCLYLSESGSMTFDYVDKEFFEAHPNEKISIRDFFAFTLDDAQDKTETYHCNSQAIRDQRATEPAYNVAHQCAQEKARTGIC